MKGKTVSAKGNVTVLDVGERIRMYLVAGGITLCLILNWLLP